MNAVNSRIIAMYESEEMTPEEIAMDEDLEVEVVKAALLQGSTAYRRAMRGSEDSDKEEPFMTGEEFRQIKAAYKNIALNEEVDAGVRERALRNLINEHKGRNDVANLVKNGGNVNLIMLNESLLKARKAIEAARARRDIIIDASPAPQLVDKAA